MKLFYPLVILFLINSAFAQKNKSSYEYTIDLTQVVNEKVKVNLIPPKTTEDEALFYLPQIVPGTYRIADYGRYISDFEAFAKDGRKLAVQKIDSNGWKISGASRMVRISYWVQDTFHHEKEGPDIFDPAGTNIEEHKNFVINTSGFCGYLEKIKDVPYKINVIRPREFYGATGLVAKSVDREVGKLDIEHTANDDSRRVDTYQTDDYDRLIDSPMMYSMPDTTVIKVANTEVLIGSYSPNQKITAKEIGKSLKEILMAQKDYLGGKLPVNKYAFIFYFTDRPAISYGALEHSYSSMYYIPETPIADIDAQLRNMAAHEFFHIVTPLNIHSEEVHRFGFNKPNMSKHLWLYEGVTEYFANSVQVKSKLITDDEYLKRMEGKIVSAQKFIDDVPFTDISKMILEKYEEQFPNVYQKGALIAMCLDIKLRSLSSGNYGIQNLMFDLAKKYGKSNPFKDDELFGEIGKITYPEISRFLLQYVGGSDPLPFKDVLALVGVTYNSETTREYTLGLDQAALSFKQVDGTIRFVVAKADLLNPQGKAVGFHDGDLILKINDKPWPATPDGLTPYLVGLKESLKEGDTLSYLVSRKNDNNQQTEILLNTPVIKIERERTKINFATDAAPQQVAIRKSWLGEMN